MKKILILILPLSLLLQGCIPLIVGAAAAGGLAYYNRKTIVRISNDGNISLKANKLINADPALTRNSHIVIVPFYGNVLLVGQVGTPAKRMKVECIVKSVAGVKRVYNHIILSGPTSPMTRSSDAWITTKVKTEMVTAKGLRSMQIKVVTENGNVYLMGKGNQRQAKLAINVARHVSGVQHVITLFE